MWSLTMLLVRVLVNSRLLVDEFWGSQKLQMDWLFSLTSTLFKDQLHFILKTPSCSFLNKYVKEKKQNKTKHFLFDSISWHSGQHWEFLPCHRVLNFKTCSHLAAHLIPTSTLCGGQGWYCYRLGWKSSRSERRSDLPTDGTGMTECGNPA